VRVDDQGIIATVPTLSIGGADLPVDWYDALVELRVELEFGVPGRALLRFADEGYALTESGKAKLGAGVVVGGLRPGQRAADTLIKGEITGINVEQSATDDPELVLVVHDKAQRFARATLVGTYINSSVSDVVSKIAKRHGLAATVQAPPTKLEYMMQVDTDLALLDAMAHRTGHDWWVDDTTLYFMPPGRGGRSNTKVELVLGQNLRQFTVRASGLHPDSVKVDGWDRRKQQTVTGTASASGASVVADSEMFAAFVSPGSKLGGTATLVAAGLNVQDLGEARQLAEALRDQVVASSVNATGTALHGSQIAPGVQVVVQKAGPTSGTYHVTKVEHVYRERFETRFVAGERRPSSLVDTLGGGAAPVATLQHHGLVVGQVTNNNDDEAKSGRVKVRYPGLAEDEESAWARVVTLGGGAKRGLVILPEVGDEVLVGFEGSDLRQPVILGGLFGDKHTIPLWDVANGQVAGRRLTSRLGHVVELKDGTAPAEQHVLLQLEGAKHKIRLGKDECEIAVPSGVPFSIKVGDNASLVFDASGSLKIKAVNIAIEAEGSFTTKSKAMTKIESTSALTVEGQMTNVKGSVVQVQSSGPATIKGTPVAIN
jgi:uncharacterized protein involved in type VI secretion and phage assembly